MDTNTVYSNLSAGSSVSSGVVTAYFIFLGVLVILQIIGFWKVFVKAGRPGWAALIPFYNLYTECKVAKRPGWWLILFFIPFVNIIIWFIVAIDIAKNFGKGTGFGVLLAIFPMIASLVLGFGSAQYIDGAQPQAA
jgi:Family of unknown function (DUF5684)